MRYLASIRIGGKTEGRAVRVAEIDFIVAVGSCAELHVGDRRFVVRDALHVLERRLDPRMFMRVHQSSIVRLECVSQFLPADIGDHEIQLMNGTRLRVSRSRREAIQRRLAAVD